MAIDLDSYNTVPERISEFYAKYPEGSLNRLLPDGTIAPLEFVTYAGADWVILTAFAYRNPDDKNPGVGTAWERIPGTTQFTKGSEIQNAETSAWGRAIVAMGAADAKKGIASREEVALAQTRQEPLPERPWVEEAKALYGADAVRQKWVEAKRHFGRTPSADQQAILDDIAALGTEAAAREAKDAADVLALRERAQAAMANGFGEQDETALAAEAEADLAQDNEVS